MCLKQGADATERGNAESRDDPCGFGKLRTLFEECESGCHFQTAAQNQPGKRMDGWNGQEKSVDNGKQDEVASDFYKSGGGFCDGFIEGIHYIFRGGYFNEILFSAFGKICFGLFSVSKLPEQVSVQDAGTEKGSSGGKEPQEDPEVV